MENLLIIKKIRPDRLRNEVAFIFARLRVPERAAKKKIIFIKPNIFCREPAETGATTDLKLLGVVIDYFATLGKKVWVGEAGANQYAQTGMFRELGIDRFCREHEAEFLDLNVGPFVPIELYVKGKSHAFLTPAPLLEADFLVNLPKFKTHLSTRVSWAIKNLYGLLPDKEKWRGHQLGIHEILIALSQRFPAQLVLMDGIVAMKGLGPTMGLPEEKNLLFGAAHQFVCDLGLLRLLQIRHVPHIERCTNGRRLEVRYLFLDEENRAANPDRLGLQLRLPPRVFSRFFCKTNQVFFTLAPHMEKFINPKSILNFMANPRLTRFIRNVQKLLKV